MFFLTHRITGQDLAQSFASAGDAADFLVTIEGGQDTYDITFRS